MLNRHLRQRESTHTIRSAAVILQFPQRFARTDSCERRIFGIQPPTRSYFDGFVGMAVLGFSTVLGTPMESISPMGSSHGVQPQVIRSPLKLARAS